jgi:hypothetical protein
MSAVDDDVEGVVEDAVCRGCERLGDVTINSLSSSESSQSSLDGFLGSTFL